MGGDTPHPLCYILISRCTLMIGGVTQVALFFFARSQLHLRLNTNLLSSKARFLSPIANLDLL